MSLTVSVSPSLRRTFYERVPNAVFDNLKEQRDHAIKRISMNLTWVSTTNEAFNGAFKHNVADLLNLQNPKTLYQELDSFYRSALKYLSSIARSYERDDIYAVQETESNLTKWLDYYSLAGLHKTSKLAQTTFSRLGGNSTAFGYEIEAIIAAIVDTHLLIDGLRSTYQSPLLQENRNG